jgi:hypothetical protein
VQHDNGLGQPWFDCVPLQTYDETQARAAGTAWRDVGTFLPAVCPNSSCIDRTSSLGTDCARWCYSGSLAGFVYFNSTPGLGQVCLCPDPTGVNSGFTHVWQ